MGVLFNSVFVFGEEIGWCGWFFLVLCLLGIWLVFVLSGVIWGLWYSLVILFGYNFGWMDIMGVFFMIGGCVVWGVLFGWLCLCLVLVWFVVIVYGLFNVVGGFIVLFVVV